MKLPSYVGEASAVIAVLNFILWSYQILPEWTKWLLVPFALLFIIDWMLGGIADNGICKKCFSR